MAGVVTVFYTYTCSPVILTLLAGPQNQNQNQNLVVQWRGVARLSNLGLVFVSSFFQPT